ncbi:MAG TPA: AraC family transcriptional regulator [Candidatus Anaerostipes excrementavium]|uniref:AraC family transcriptional regulator n=1 Tax=Candidatus Anaerostipes excrementavium TaxID=2838463 RepID=A0A9D1WTX5_9FIRM|nr:AraC family transcriptional regulator [uncultured Anaerostipes sp.]HIX67026.1 AraC family transcriptional regulator [Candidatus Anaerostipes excrementavium]
MEDAYVLQLKNRKFSEFYLCFCGYADCSPLHSFGPAVRPNYLIHLILQGKGKYMIGEESYNLEAGEGFLIEPEVSTFYQADAEQPWSYMWVGFSGTKAKEYLRDIGLGGEQKTFRFRNMEELKKMQFDIMKRDNYSVENEFLRESFLYHFFAVLSRSIKVESKSKSESQNLYVQRAVEYIQNHYFYQIHVTDIADYVGVTRGYLYHLFVKHLATSPQEYLIRYRISRGMELLSVSELSIEDISRSCGYEDPLVFSKLFKKKVGDTPSQYRKENWQTKKEDLRKRKENLDYI